MKSWKWVVLAGFCLGMAGPALAKGKRQKDYEQKQNEILSCKGLCEKDSTECSNICKKMAGSGSAKCTKACGDEAKECEKRCDGAK